ncbi:MAG: hypothetical protein QXX55_00985 [Candidatus Pacearchaeota archaeon]
MKLFGEIQYYNREKILFFGDIYRKISFSLYDFDKRDLSSIIDVINSYKYNPKKSNPEVIKSSKNFAEAEKYLFYKFGGHIELNYYPTRKNINIFIKGFDAEELGESILDLIDKH